MIDLFGSKNLLEVLNNLYEENEIGNKVISSTLESQFASTISPTSRLESLTELEKEVISADFRKFFRVKNHNDILFMDLLSERNGIGNYRNSKITMNSEVKNYLEEKNLSTIMLDNRIKLIPGLVKDLEKSVNDYNRVIVCEFYLTNYHLDQDNMIKMNPNQYSINKVNALLKTFYDYIKFNNPNFTFISFDEIYSKVNNNGKVSPWIYSEFSNNNIKNIISKFIN